MNHWHELIANINTWQRGQERAVHKPLLTLMLLARAQSGGSNEVPYSEISSDLKQALREFGPPRKRHHPELPFWYLKNDGFWTLPHAHELEFRKNKRQPTHRELLKQEAIGIVREDLWRDLLENPDETRSLAQSILREFWPDTYHKDIASFVGLEVEAVVASKKRDPKFRERILRAYERRCAICAYDGRLDDVLIGLEAAHVKFKQQGGPDVVENGLALCSLHHKVFDRGGMGLDEECRVIVSQSFAGHGPFADFVLKYNGKPLAGPQAGCPPPAEEYVAWHRRNVFQGDVRAAG